MRQPDRERNWMGRNLRWVLMLLGAIGIVLAARMAISAEPKGGELIDQDIAQLERLMQRSQQELGMMKIRLETAEATIAELEKLAERVIVLEGQVQRLDRLAEIFAFINGGTPEWYLANYEGDDLTRERRAPNIRPTPIVVEGATK